MRLKKISIATLICLSGFAFGQTLPESSQGIQVNFSQKSIQAYQENSQYKIVEFYEYLTLYSNEKDVELRNQIRENIYSLIDSKETELLDFTNPDLTEIEIDNLLSKILNRNYTFKIKPLESSEKVDLNQWTNQYELSVNDVTITINQIIYFKPVQKHFGSKTKTVWDMKLGNQF